MKIRVFIVGLLLLLGAIRPQPAAAHPLDVLFQDMRVQLFPAEIVLEVHLIAGPLITPRLWADLDSDGSDTLEQAEIEAWCAAYLAQLDVRFDDTRQVFALASVVQFPATRAEFIGASATDLEWTASAALPAGIAAGEHRLDLRSAAYRDIGASDWSKTRGRAGIVVREATTSTSHEATFPIKWPATPAPGSDQPEAAADPASGLSQGGSSDSLVNRLRSGDGSLGLIAGALALAFGFGALHALQPGHGKTLVAAYLVGSRGTIRHAILLGGIVTFTHTASVLVLGTLVLIFSAWVNPQQIIPGLTVASGALVAAVGLKLLWDRWRLLRGGHGHDHADDHHHHDSHTHSHAHAHSLSGRSLISLGVSGGLVPCPEALVILIVAATIGRLGLGLAMIVCFSLGLAAVLIAIGVVLVTVGERLFGRVPRNGRLMQALPILSAALVVGLGVALAVEGMGTLL